MRLGFVHPAWPGAEGTGATHTATQIVQGLAAAGHRVTVYCGRAPEGAVETRENLRLERLVPRGLTPHRPTRLRRAILDRADDLAAHELVTSYLPLMTGTMAELRARTGTPVTVTLNAYRGVCPKNDLLHRGRERCRTRSPARCARCLAASAREQGYRSPVRTVLYQLGNLALIERGRSGPKTVDAFRAPSRHVREAYAAFGFPAERIWTIPHPVDDRFRVPHTSAFDPPLRLLYVGGLSHWKGADRLVPILAGLRPELEARLTVVGEGDAGDLLRRQARERQVEDRVRLCGRLPHGELPEVYAAHDLLLHPGRWEEPLARVFLEALAAGTPVLASDVGSVAEILGGGGATVEGSVESFVAAVDRMAGSGELPALSRRAREASERYGRERVVARVEEMYRSVLAGTNGREG